MRTTATTAQTKHTERISIVGLIATLVALDVSTFVVLGQYVS
jgi:hypothetical protein